MREFINRAGVYFYKLHLQVIYVWKSDVITSWVNKNIRRHRG